jgi:hypothetical protein
MLHSFDFTHNWDMEAIMVPDSDSTKLCTLGDLGYLEVLLAITKEQIVSANLLPLTELRQCFRYSGTVRSDGEIEKKNMDTWMGRIAVRLVPRKSHDR